MDLTWAGQGRPVDELGNGRHSQVRQARQGEVTGERETESSLRTAPQIDRDLLHAGAEAGAAVLWWYRCAMGWRVPVYLPVPGTSHVVGGSRQRYPDLATYLSRGRYP